MNTSLDAMSDLVGQYLRVRRALGYKLNNAEDILNRFVAYLEVRDADRGGMIKSCGWSPGAGVRGTHLLGDDLSVTEILIMGRRWKRWSGKVRPCPM